MKIEDAGYHISNILNKKTIQNIDRQYIDFHDYLYNSLHLDEKNAANAESNQENEVIRQIQNITGNEHVYLVDEEKDKDQPTKNVLFIMQNKLTHPIYRRTYSYTFVELVISKKESHTTINIYRTDNNPVNYIMFMVIFNYLGYNNLINDNDINYHQFIEHFRKVNLQENKSDINSWKGEFYQNLYDLSLDCINTLKRFVKTFRFYNINERAATQIYKKYYNEAIDAAKFYLYSPLVYKNADKNKNPDDIKKTENKERENLNMQYQLFTEDEINELPIELKLSYKNAKEIYKKNAEFLSAADKGLIKSFKRGKTWSAAYYGPSGTGKTTKLMSVAGALGLPVLKVVGSRNIDESYLFGKYILKNGETVFQYGPLSKAMKYGAMFIFDEINMCDSDILSSLNDILDGTRTKILDNGEVIEAHKNFRFAESMNIGYHGTNDINLSHKSRIQNKIKVSSLSEDTMGHIISKESDIPVDVAIEMSKMIKRINNYIDRNGDNDTQRIDLRHIINWANKTIDLDGDIVEASLTTIIASLAENDESVENIDYESVSAGDNIATAVLELIEDSFGALSPELLLQNTASE